MKLTPKKVVYWCRGCKREVVREGLIVAHKVRESYCSTAGKTVKMRRLRWSRQ